MTTINQEKQSLLQSLSIWFYILIPLVALSLMLSIFAFGNPLALFTSDLPPVEELTFERIRVTPDGFETTLINGGPDPVTVAQVTVDEAYWDYTISPDNTIPRLGRASLSIPYPWVESEFHEIVVVTETGTTFNSEVEIATLTPEPGINEFVAYGLLGIYVGIIPVALGMLWYPALKRLDRKWLSAILALTLGLLVFLLIDTLLEAFEVVETLPGAFQGIPLVIFAALLTWLILLAIGSQRKKVSGSTNQRLYVAALIALGIGLHNLGEGLAIGTAFSLGAVALGSFLVIGFTLHNITEGVGIVAPLIPSKSEGEAGNQETPRLRTFIWLVLLAGAPAILGTWVGGFAFSPLVAALFLGIGIGAIWQVIVEVGSLLRRDAEAQGVPLASWTNLVGFFAGIAIMYLTAFLVKF
jgi:zinc transporter ZupT